MHQTFYVDVDEEVNSVISRLRKSTSQYNILAVAQQALILQSSVSLRLIKKEMDMLKKKVMIVTQDERGLAMAKKVGFPVKKTMDEVKKNEEVSPIQTEAVIKENVATDTNKNESSEEINLNERNRLRNLGDSDYISIDHVAIGKPIEKNEKKSKIVKKTDSGLDRSKEEGFSDLFVESNAKAEAPKSKKRIAGGAKKFLWFFSFVSVALVIIIFAYLLFPKAEIDITPKKIQKNINLTIEAQDSNEQKSESMLDVVSLDSLLLEADEVLSLNFDATGEKASANKKARGTITIFNNFSEASQILVATTRFLSEDGKLFRLTKNVTVPGMKVEDGKKVTGEIKAEVIADQPGEEYNIDSTKFTIPGFEGGPKYSKFSAESDEKMKGGGEGNSDFKTVSQTDIDNAEKESLEKIKNQLVQKIKEAVGDENVFSEESIDFEVLDSASFPEIGAIADSFEYQIKARAKYLTFSEKELDGKIDKYISENVLSQGFPVRVVSANKKYGKSENNFSENSVKTKLSVNVILEAEINAEEIKQELLGKNQEEVDAFIKDHPELQKIDATILPNFLASKIPKYPYRVDINIISN